MKINNKYMIYFHGLSNHGNLFKDEIILYASNIDEVVQYFKSFISLFGEFKIDQVYDYYIKKFVYVNNINR